MKPKKNLSVVLFYRSKSTGKTRAIQELKAFLNSKKIAFFERDQKEEASFPPATLIISLGGDGTYLKAVKLAKQTPIMGVNMGSLGFLTPHPLTRLLNTLENFFKGKAQLKKNYFLKSVLTKKTSSQKTTVTQKTFQAVNDMVIERGSFNHLISLSIYINKEYIYSLKADGVIVSSPMGSTAYNLAAGGPILHSKVSAFVITPICSHSLTNRPLVIPDQSEIEIVLDKTKAYLTMDGLTQTEISTNSKLTLTKSQQSFVSLINEDQTDFLLLRRKLQFGQRN